MTRIMPSRFSLVTVMALLGLSSSASSQDPLSSWALPTPQERVGHGVDTLGREVHLQPPFDFVTLHELVGGLGQRAIQIGQLAAGPVYVDADSILQIGFRIDRVQTHPLFGAGKISLEAQLNTRPIEVEGYSEVGKERTTVGLTGLTPERFVLNVQQFQAELFATTGDLGNLDAFLEQAKLVERLLGGFWADRSSSAAFMSALQLSPVVIENRLSNIRLHLKLADVLRGNSDSRTSLQATYNQLYESWQATDGRMIEIRRTRDDLEAQLGQVDDQLRQADLGPAEKRRLADRQKQLKVEVDSLEKRALQTQGEVDERQAKMDAILRPLWDLQYELSLLSNEVNRELAVALSSAIETSRLLDGGITQETLQQVIHQLSGSAVDRRPLPDGKTDKISDSELRAVIRAFWGLRQGTGSEATRKDIAIKHIYRNLVAGRIVLSREGARRGDKIYIYLRLLPDGDVNSDEERPIRFTLAELEVEEFGWSRGVIDSFLLVKRHDEPEGDNVSPSNFKGAAGASLLWRNRRRPERTTLASRFLDVSFGLNVSYIDFDTTKDIEIGVGPVIGFADDQVVLTAGWNLNGDGKRFYLGLGLSFAKIKEKFDANAKAEKQ